MRYLRKRSKRFTIVAILACLIVPAAAFAAYMLEVNGSGSGTTAPLGAAGTITDPVSVVFNGSPRVILSGNDDTAFNPGDEEMFNVKVDNTGSSSAVAYSSVQLGTISTSVSGCKASWFSVTRVSGGLTGTVAAGVVATVGTYNLLFNDDGASDQNPCAGATVTLPYTVS